MQNSFFFGRTEEQRVYPWAILMSPKFFAYFFHGNGDLVLFYVTRKGKR